MLYGGDVMVRSKIFESNDSKNIEQSILYNNTFSEEKYGFPTLSLIDLILNTHLIWP